MPGHCTVLFYTVAAEFSFDKPANVQRTARVSFRSVAGVRASVLLVQDEHFGSRLQYYHNT